jgi:hypothetical protein
MQPQINQPLLNTIFGEFYGKKLMRLLSDCCQPHILIKMCATCAGLNASGVQQYNVTASATYNMNVSGYTTLIGYLSNQPLPNWINVTNDTLNNLTLKEGTIFVGPITANVPIVSANITVANFNPGTYYAMVTDNRGNYAAPITINFPNCGSTPAQSGKSLPTG